MSVQDTIWHRDGHVMHLQLRKEALEIMSVSCPEGDACQVDGNCIVEWFLLRFGLECNVGICDPAPDLEVAWTMVGEDNDLNACQIWVIPVDDEAFSAWLVTQNVSDQYPSDGNTPLAD
jgi:hypothetical protein